ncbi:MAG: DUF2254 domain-containing protein [Nocardioidaceae bacterium]
MGSPREIVARMLDSLRTRLWPLPAIGVVVAVVVAIAFTKLDAAVDDDLPTNVSDLIFGGDAEAARSLLAAIAGSLITVTSLTFSLTVVTLQLASSQFSPRLLRTFTRDRFVQATLAVFLATFVYALTVLRTVRTEHSNQAEVVPQMSVTFGFLLALASVLALVLFLAHLVRQIRVETMLEQVHDDARQTALRELSERQPGHVDEALPETPENARLVLARGSGFLNSVDSEVLMRAVCDQDAAIAVQRVLGSFVVAGTPVAAVWPRAAAATWPDEEFEQLTERCSAALELGFERTSIHDVSYGLRQLADVATKALSPGINDPTTACHTIDKTAALLSELAARDLGPELVRDDDGAVRVAIPRSSFGELLDLAVHQPRRYGAADPGVVARLFWLLRDLAWSTDVPSHRAEVRTQLSRLQRSAAQQDFDPEEEQQIEAYGREVEAALDGRWIGPATS